MSNILKLGSHVAGQLLQHHEVYCDGYLLEHDYEKGTCDPIVISLCGKKKSIDNFVKFMKEANVYIQTPGQTSFDKKSVHTVRNVGVNFFSSSSENQHLLVVKAVIEVEGPKEALRQYLSTFNNASINRTEFAAGKPPYTMTINGSEETTNAALKALASLKACGAIASFTIKDRQQEGSLFKRYVFVAKKARQDDITGDTTEAYMVGRTKAEARAQFWTILDQLYIPVDISWEETFWDAFTRMGWVKELDGHRMAGYKLAIPAIKEHAESEGFDLYDLLARLITDDVLPNIVPEEELKETLTVKAEFEPEPYEVPAQALLAA